MPAADPAGFDQRWGLAPSQLEKLDRLLDRLESDDLAPTTVRDRGKAARVHIADSLAALTLEELPREGLIADIGSGAGFPGLPLAVALPAATLNLIESQRRKCDFLASTVKSAAVANASVVCARVEEWAEGAGRHAAVLARALAPQPVVLEYAAPLLHLGGALIDWRGKRSAGEERDADAAATVLGLRRRTVQRVTPFAGAVEHHLHVFVKEGETPDRFPRRVGVARKRPLGA